MHKGSFLLKTNSKYTIIRNAETLCNELAKDNFRPNYTELHHGIQNIIVRNTFPELPVSHCKNDGVRKGVGTEINKGDAEKGSDNTNETQSRAIYKLNFYS